jgi:hypothetical protein
MTITVRRANEGDIPWLLGELKKFSAFAATKLPIFDPETAEAKILELVQKHVVFLAVRKTSVVGSGIDLYLPIGFIAGAIIPHFFNPKLTVFSELLWWVQEEHRGSRASVLLLNEFTEFGKRHANWITMALESLSPVNSKCLERRGYRLQERSFLLEVA